MAKWVLRVASYKNKNDIFEAIKSGEKTIETRSLNIKKPRNYSKVVPGDILVICSRETKERFEKKAVFVHVYKSVTEMAKNEPVEKIIPGVKNSEELVEIFEQLKKKWGRDYARKLENYGIVAIGME